LAKILTIEDDLDLAAAIVDSLTAERHTVEHSADGADAQYLLQVSQFDLIVCDWQLPSMSGIEIIQKFRSGGGRTPIIMLTGQTTLDHKETGLDAGADDYLTKPFAMRELLVRIKALLRRSSMSSVANVLAVGSLTLDPDRYIVTKAGKELRIAPREFALLEFMMRHPGETFSAEALRMAIMRLREAIDQDQPEGAKKSMIENIPRVGYRLREA
jgi:two-component system OmpR family response regulator